MLSQGFLFFFLNLNFNHMSNELINKTVSVLEKVKSNFASKCETKQDFEVMDMILELIIDLKKDWFLLLVFIVS